MMRKGQLVFISDFLVQFMHVIGRTGDVTYYSYFLSKYNVFVFLVA